jgi:hypothetical protein
MKNHCPVVDEGTLRAYLDNELSSSDNEVTATHLAGCERCQQHLDELRRQSEQVRTMLVEPPAPPDGQHALHRLQDKMGSRHGDDAKKMYPDQQLPGAASTKRRISMQQTQGSWFQRHRKLFAGVAALVVVVALLALPPVRAMADQLLQVFRVQKIMFVEVSSERMEQLESLDFDEDTLFVGEPEVISGDTEPQSAANVQEAVEQVGYTPHQPALFADEPQCTEIKTLDRQTMQFQVNVESSRRLLELMDITDVTLPDALGEQPITIDMPPSVEMMYECDDEQVALFQGLQPEVTLPDGVDMSLLGTTMLRVLGMTPEQAAQLSREVDLSSTFIFPFPADAGSITQVTVGNAQGLLISGGGHDGEHGGWESHRQLYWQNGDRFYVLVAEGHVGNTELITMAESIK